MSNQNNNSNDNNNNPQAGAGRPLPKKEADIFKNVVKHYEMKQYKKAIKQADTVLKKFPNHGETLAMKGLTLNYMNNNKKEEAHSLVKEGLMNDMRSHVCWHVYGLLHRSDHDYNEAIKAYKQALRVDPKNLQILRDLSMLQIQMRDLEGFALTRNTLLTLKPNAKINWMAFALARHLTGDLQGAAKVIDIYLGTLTEGSAELGRCFESSELALYKNSILAEIPNNYKEALDHLNACEGVVVDRGSWLRTRAEYQLKLKDYAAARQTVFLLFERGMTENYAIHSLYMCVLLQLDDEICDEAISSLRGTQTLATMMALSDEQKHIILDAYRTDLAQKFPHSKAIQRIPTALLGEEELRRHLEARCKTDLRKGVPSLCSELKSYLWTVENGRYIRPEDPVDIKAHPRFQFFMEMVDGYISSLESESKLPGESSDEGPETFFWVWFLKASLHEFAGEYSDAIAFVEKCLEHTPDAVDAFELKARLLRAMGNIQEAASCLDKGRELDKQDRYINNQTTRYLLQAGKEEEALKRISMFTRHEGNPEQNLYDMQCSWYELELASCLERRQEWGRSLKKYAAVAKHFDDFQEDQFDFHSYCLRKVTLRAYVSVLRFEDVVYGHSFFCQAASGIIRIYLHLFDNPASNEDEEPDYSNMTAAQRKKAKAIARKKKKASEKKEAEMKAKGGNIQNGNKNQNQKGGKPAAVVDEDPLGKEFLKKDPLEEAKKYSSMLARYAPKNLETWMLQYDVAIRRKKPLMALQALFKARSVDPNNSELFSRIVDFSGRVQTFEELSDPVQTVLKEETPQLLSCQSVESFIECAVAKIGADPLTGLPMRTAVVKAIADTKRESLKEVLSLITDGGIDARQVSVDTCRAALRLLSNLGENDAVQLWAETAKKRFPDAFQ